MKEQVKYPIVIAIICVVAAAALAYTYSKTKVRISESKKSELTKGLEFVLPADKAKIDEQKMKGGETLYIARDKAGSAVGYAAIGSAQGYSSKLEVLVGVKPDLQIIAIRILAQQETPGLGERTREVPPTKTIWRAIADAIRGAPAEPEREPPFQAQFSGKTEGQLVLVKGAASRETVSQITGATITSYAVVNAVRRAIDTIQSATQTGEAEK